MAAPYGGGGGGGGGRWRVYLNVGESCDSSSYRDLSRKEGACRKFGT
jgi:hypothetical protein